MRLRYRQVVVLLSHWTAVLLNRSERFIIVALRTPQTATASVPSAREALKLVETWKAEGYAIVSVRDGCHRRITLADLQETMERERHRG